MARKRMVTRTVTGTECEIQIVTISASEITTIKETISGEYDDTTKLMKAVKKAVETEDLKVLQILSTTKIEKCYGMLETEFLKLAKELDPETRKLLETEGDSTETTEDSTTETAPETPQETAPETKRKRGNK